MDNETKTLLEYLPPFLREYYEFKQLCKSGDIEVSSIDKAVDWNFDSAFISDCDATVLSKYERLLGIIPTSSQSIENRRNIGAVAMEYSGKYDLVAIYFKTPRILWQR